ncbi:MAG: P-loop NTPase fold protein [Bacteroidota bacterium]
MALENSSFLYEQLYSKLPRIFSGAQQAEKGMREVEQFDQSYEVLQDIAASIGADEELQPKSEAMSQQLKASKKTWEKIFQKAGNFLEFDMVSILISDLLEAFALIDDTETESRKKVHIIDDLDRRDPDHIFRMLNIFSAHQDSNYGGNKFGFDQVVLVGDVNNISHVFYHRYGPNTDFEGYISKFFSHTVYEFVNKLAVDVYLKNLIPAVEEPSAALEIIVENAIDVCTWTLYREWAQNNKIRLRDLIKHKNKFDARIGPEKIFAFKPSGVQFSRSNVRFLDGKCAEVYLDASDFGWLKMVKRLVFLMGGVEVLRNFSVSREANTTVFPQNITICFAYLLTPIRILMSENKETNILGPGKTRHLIRGDFGTDRIVLSAGWDIEGKVMYEGQSSFFNHLAPVSTNSRNWGRQEIQLKHIKHEIRRTLEYTFEPSIKWHQNGP